MAIDEQDRIYVADSCNHRIQVFDTDGPPAGPLGDGGVGAGRDVLSRTTSRWGRTAASTSASTATTGSRGSRRDGRSLGTWGTPAAGPGELNNPWALAVDSLGAVSVIDSN